MASRAERWATNKRTKRISGEDEDGGKTIGDMCFYASQQKMRGWVEQKILFKSSGGISKVIFTLFSSWLHHTKWLSMTAYPLSALFPRCLTVSGRFTKHHTHLSLFLVQTRAFLPPCENPELQASAQLTDEQSPPSALRLKYKAARLSNKAISLSLHDLSPLCCQIELQSI